MPKKFVVELNSTERQMLQEIVAKGRVLALKRQHAHILLKADQGQSGPAWPDEKIAQALDVSVRNVERVRQRLIERGLEKALVGRLDPQKSRRYAKKKRNWFKMPLLRKRKQDVCSLIPDSLYHDHQSLAVQWQNDRQL